MGDPITTRTENDAAFELATDLAKPQILKLDDGTQILVTASDVAVSSVKGYSDEYLKAPERRQGTARHTTLASFIAHAKRFADADSAIYADDSPAAPILTSVLDYHRAGADGAPRFGRHRGVYPFPLSDEWKAWTAQEGKAMAQDAFCAFLEDRIVDVADPSTALATAKGMAGTLGADFAGPSRLLELSRGLAIRVNSRVGKFVNLSSGESQLQYTTEHADESGAPLKVPSLFLIAIPIFVAGAMYQLSVRLRYRVTSGVVAWSYEVVRRSYALRDAVKDAAEEAARETTLPLFFGTPEA